MHAYYDYEINTVTFDGATVQGFSTDPLERAFRMSVDEVARTAAVVRERAQALADDMLSEVARLDRFTANGEVPNVNGLGLVQSRGPMLDASAATLAQAVRQATMLAALVRNQQEVVA